MTLPPLSPPPRIRPQQRRLNSSLETQRCRLGGLVITMLLGLGLAMSTYAMHRERQLLRLQQHVH